MSLLNIVQALVEDQSVPEVELSRMRRARYIRDIPDTLYMVEDKPRGMVSVDVLAAALPGKDADAFENTTRRVFCLSLLLELHV